MDLTVKTYLTAPQAAEYSGVPQATLATLRSRGGGPRFIKRPGGKRILYRKVDLDAWLEAGLRGSTSAPHPTKPMVRQPQKIEHRPSDAELPQTTRPMVRRPQRIEYRPDDDGSTTR
jgi:hypothetical protein